MRLDDVRLAILPRKNGGSIDLAGALYREHFARLFALSSLFAIPTTILVWFFSRSDSGALFAATSFFFLSPFLGALVVAAVGPWIFGEVISVRSAAARVREVFWSLGAHLIGWRLLALAGWFSLLLPGAALHVFESFIAEVVILEQQRFRRVTGRLRDLGSGRWIDLAGRRLFVCAFSVNLILSIFLLVELLSTFVFGVPFALGRAIGSAWAEELVDVFLFESRAPILLNLLAWYLYPLFRVARFLNYLDVRIRKEAWDIELDFRQRASELERIEGQA